MPRIFIDFDDAQAADVESPEELYRNIVTPLSDLFKNVSYGQLRLAIKPDLSFCRMPGNFSSYLRPQSNGPLWITFQSLAQYVDDDAALGDTHSGDTMEGFYIILTKQAKMMPRSVSNWARPLTLHEKRINVTHGVATLGQDIWTSNMRTVMRDTAHLLGLPYLTPFDEVGLLKDVYAGQWSLSGNASSEY
jgi:hypothetical protein